MFAFYRTSDGEIISVVQASSQPTAPDGYGYVDFTHGASETHKYKIENGVLVEKPESDVDDIELARATLILRRKRDQMLASCDWTQVPDAPVDQAAWATYRQALRDLPANTSDPANPVWPSQPT